MALSNYSDLKASIIKWSHREDISALVDDFINLAESEIYGNSVDPLRLRSMEVRSTANTETTSRFIALPDRFLAMRRLSIVDSVGNSDVDYLSPEQMTVTGVTGRPQFFTVTTQIEFNRTPDQEYDLEMAYYQKFLAIDSTNSTNLLLTDFPNIYLFGSLWSVFQYAADEEKAEYYYQKFIGAIQGANKQDKRGRYGPAPRERIEGYYP